MPLVPSNDNAYEERHLTSDHYCELQDIPVLVIIEIGCYSYYADIHYQVTLSVSRHEYGNEARYGQIVQDVLRLRN